MKLAPSSFFIIIHRCDIGVVLHLLGHFAKNRSRCIFIDGSIAPCLWVWDSHTPSCMQCSNRFIFIDGSIAPCLLVWDSHTPSCMQCSNRFICPSLLLFVCLLLCCCQHPYVMLVLGVVQNCHHFQKSTQNTLGEQTYNGHRTLFKMLIMIHCIFIRGR